MRRSVAKVVVVFVAVIALGLLLFNVTASTQERVVAQSKVAAQERTVLQRPAAQMATFEQQTQTSQDNWYDWNWWWRRIVPADAVIFGRPYSEWSAEWWQWAFSIPANTNPLLHDDSDVSTYDCGVGQSGPVWFLGGTFCAGGGANCGVKTVVRTCTIPADKGLYIAIVNAEESALENPTNKQIAQLRAGTAATIHATSDVHFSIDGYEVTHLKSKFRVQSPAFGFTLPSNNLLQAIYPSSRSADFAAGTYFPAVDDGVYVMLQPLHAGHHTLKLSGTFSSNFGVDVTYKLTVLK